MKNKFKQKSEVREDGVERWWVVTPNNVSSDFFYNKDDVSRYMKRCESLEEEFKIEEYFYPPHMKKPSFRIEFEESFVLNFISWFEKMGGEDHNKDEIKNFSSFSLYGRYFRVLPSIGIIQMGDSDFDRWANSVEETSDIPLTEEDFVACMIDFKSKLDDGVIKNSLIELIVEDLKEVDYIVLSQLFESLSTDRVDYKKDRVIYDIEELLLELTTGEVEKFNTLIKSKKEQFHTN
jgi:hypothetical protein